MRRIILLAAAVLALAACTSQPIYNVERQAIVTGSGRAPTMAEVESAIVRGGSVLGWAMTPVRPGVVSGRLALRTHVAIVDVNYDTKQFSINYKDSTNLDYANGSIHRNYNGWITNLDREIRANLSRL